MRRLRQAVIALLALLLSRGDRGDDDGGERRIVQDQPSHPRLEVAVAALLFLAGACGVAFVVLYAIDGLADQTQWLGIALGLCLALVAVALIAASKGIVPSEELEGEYPQEEHPDDQEFVGELARQSVSPITRKRLLASAASVAGGGILLAAVTPALSLGPWIDTGPLYRTPWRKGRRLVDSGGVPMRANDLAEETFYTAYPEGGSHDDIAAPLVVVRVATDALMLPPERSGWAPGGIVAFSKICTHAACAISLYRTPTFAPTQPQPALVCPCHYSTFDPARGGEVVFGPAGRALPQLPLEVDADGHLRAGGDYSGPVGPSFGGVRKHGERS